MMDFELQMMDYGRAACNAEIELVCNPGMGYVFSALYIHAGD